MKCTNYCCPNNLNGICQSDIGADGQLDKQFPDIEDNDTVEDIGDDSWDDHYNDRR